MRLSPRILLVVALVAVGGCGGAVSDVKFASGVAPKTVEIAGALHRPAGDGPFPAVVLLHTCAGVRPHVPAWAAWLAREGYAALVVDSFTPRGATNVCATLADPTVHEFAWDAFAALAHLRTRPFIDRDRIAVMGWSYGAMAALDASRAYFIQTAAGGRGFRAAVPFYPHCSYLSSDTAIPVLLLLAGADDWTPPAQCVDKATALRREGRPVFWHVYPDVTHGFDQADLGTRQITVLGHVIRYDGTASSDAERRVRAFLAEHVKGAQRR